MTDLPDFFQEHRLAKRRDLIARGVNPYPYQFDASHTIAGVIKEFGDGNGVVYVDQPSDVVRRAEEIFYSGYAALIRHGTVARKFVEKYNWERVARDFKAILDDVIEGKASA